MTQNDKLIQLLKDSNWHSNMEILNKISIWRVSARIFDLKKRGYTIETKNGEGALYWYRMLVEPEQMSMGIDK
jgi:biotin operon repressor